MLLKPIRAAASEESVPVAARLRRIVGHHVRLVLEQDSLPILLLAEASNSADPALIERMRRLLRNNRAILDDLIRRGQASRELTEAAAPDCPGLGLIGLTAILAIQHRLDPDARLEKQFEQGFVPWFGDLAVQTEKATP